MVLGVKAYYIDDVNTVLGFECYDAQGQPTGNEPTVYGCTDPNALNYDPLANQNDGSCEMPAQEIEGCTDPLASNYNPDATLENGACQFSIDYTSTTPLASNWTDQLPTCPNTSTGTLAQLLGTNLTVGQANYAMGEVCWDSNTGNSLYWTPPPANMIQTNTIATEKYSICVGETPLDTDIYFALVQASYPLSATDFNSIIGWNCLNPDTAVVQQILSNGGGGATTAQSRRTETTGTITTDFDSTVFDNNILGDADETPTTSIDGTSGTSDINLQNSLTSSTKEKSKNFGGNSTKNGGCLDPIALNFDDGAQFDDGSCMY